MPLELAGHEDGHYVYRGAVPARTSGLHGYAVRVLPRHEDVLVPNELPADSLGGSRGVARPASLARAVPRRHCRRDFAFRRLYAGVSSLSGSIVRSATAAIPASASSAVASPISAPSVASSVVSAGSSAAPAVAASPLSALRREPCLVQCHPGCGPLRCGVELQREEAPS